MREKRQKILIVEDEPILRQGLEVLGDWGKNGLILIGSVQNGREALELMATELPDIIITDIMMPVMDGIELIKRVKIQYPEVEIIVLSNYSDFQYVRQAMKAGAADYLLKVQIDFDSLLDVVNKVGEDILHRKRIQEFRIPDELESERSAFLKRLLFCTEVEDKDAEKSAESLGLIWNSRRLAVYTVEFFKDKQELRGEEKAELLNRKMCIRDRGYAVRTEALLDSLFHKTDVLESIVITGRGEISEEAFRDLAKSLADGEGIRAIQYLPGGAVLYCYPLEGNEAVIGNNVFDNPRRRDDALLAVDTREIALSGPYSCLLYTSRCV